MTVAVVVPPVVESAGRRESRSQTRRSQEPSDVTPPRRKPRARAGSANIRNVSRSGCGGASRTRVTATLQPRAERVLDRRPLSCPATFRPQTDARIATTVRLALSHTRLGGVTTAAVPAVVSRSARHDERGRGDNGDSENSAAAAALPLIRLQLLSQKGEQGNENDARIAVPEVRPVRHVHRDPCERVREELVVGTIVQSG